MATQDTDMIYGLYPETLALPAGVTVPIVPLPGQNSCVLKWFSGGSLSIFGASISQGCSFATANTYLLGTTEILNIDCTGKFYLIATGSTCVAYLLRGRSAGYEG